MNEKLWAVHLQGPDDILAQPDLGAAEAAAMGDRDVEVIEWPGSAASHAEQLERDGEATREARECPGCGSRVGQDHADCPTGYSGAVDRSLAEVPI